MPTINDGKKVILTSGPHPNVTRQTGSLKLNDGDVIEDASGHDRIKFTDSGATIIYDEAGNASLTVNTDQSTTFANHITSSGNISSSGNYFGVSASFARLDFVGAGDTDVVFSGSATQTGSIGHIIASNNSIQFGTGADAEFFNRAQVRNIRRGKRAKALTIPTFTHSDTTPSVDDGTVFKTHNTSNSTIITDFDDGQAGEIITVICSNANTRFNNGSGLINAGATQLRCATNDTFQWVYDGTTWFNIGTSDNS